MKIISSLPPDLRNMVNNREYFKEALNKFIASLVPDRGNVNVKKLSHIPFKGFCMYVYVCVCVCVHVCLGAGVRVLHVRLLDGIFN